MRIQWLSRAPGGGVAAGHTRPRTRAGVRPPASKAGLVPAVAVAAGVLGAAAPVLAQEPAYGLRLLVDDAELLPGQSTTIRLEAFFDDTRDYAMGGVATDLLFPGAGDGLRDPTLLDPMDGPGTEPGVPGGDGVTGILAGQLHAFPYPMPPYLGDPSNPMAFFEVTYTAPADVPAGGLTLDLATRTSRFTVYLERYRSASESRLDELAEASATIRVVPAPGAAAALALGGLCAIARPRRRALAAA